MSFQFGDRCRLFRVNSLLFLRVVEPEARHDPELWRRGHLLHESQVQVDKCETLVVSRLHKNEVVRPYLDEKLFHFWRVVFGHEQVEVALEGGRW